MIGIDVIHTFKRHLYSYLQIDLVSGSAEWLVDMHMLCKLSFVNYLGCMMLSMIMLELCKPCELD